MAIPTVVGQHFWSHQQRCQSLCRPLAGSRCLQNYARDVRSLAPVEHCASAGRAWMGVPPRVCSILHAEMQRNLTSTEGQHPAGLPTGPTGLAMSRALWAGMSVRQKKHLPKNGHVGCCCYSQALRPGPKDPRMADLTDGCHQCVDWMP